MYKELISFSVFSEKHIYNEDTKNIEYGVGTNLKEVFHHNASFHPIPNNRRGVMAETDEYINCPFCNQQARREDIEDGTHVCWGPHDNSHRTLGIWD